MGFVRGGRVSKTEGPPSPTEKRITAAQALAHAYFAQYHDPDDEPVADPYDQSFESRDLLIDEWKSESRAG